MRDVVIMASAAAWRGRKVCLVIVAQRRDRRSKTFRCNSGTVVLRVLGGARIRVFPDAALHCLILLRRRPRAYGLRAFVKCRDRPISVDNGLEPSRHHRIVLKSLPNLAVAGSGMRRQAPPGGNGGCRGQQWVNGRYTVFEMAGCCGLLDPFTEEMGYDQDRRLR